MYRLASIVIVLGSLAACTNEGPIAEDGRDDSFTSGGKLDGFTCSAAEAAAILQVVNTASLSTLESDVGLSTKAADNIVAVRKGDDEVAGTADDTTFGSLAQLDAVPYIGPMAFAKLLQYVHDADLVGDVPVAGHWESATIANGDHSDYALTPDGTPVVVYRVGTRYDLQLADGSVATLPSDIETFYDAGTQVAVDEHGVAHVFYRLGGQGPTTWKHLSWRNGQWSQHESIATSRLWIDQSSSGTIFALASKPNCSSNCVSTLTLYTVAPDGNKTAETLWTVSPDDDIGLSVGNDNYPAIVWGSGRVHHARRGPAGWTTLDVNATGSLYSEANATTAGPNATVFAASAGLATYRQSGTTFTALDHLDFTAYTPAIDAATDSLGTAHACFERNGNVIHVVAETTGTVTETVVGNAEDCWLGTDGGGKLHLFYRLGSVINHATYE